MNGEELLQELRDAVKPKPRPAVLLSGGLDSTILLHHLKEKTKEKIHTYTIGLEDDDFEYGTLVAEHYNTTHKNVEIKDILPTFAKLQAHLDRPRWNLWPYWGYHAAWEDGRNTVYIGEGMDEHFGGYWYKPDQTYQEYWASVLAWSIPTHTQIAYLFGLSLETPFRRLDITQTRPFWDEKHQDKTLLRHIYNGILPDFVIERKKNPGRIDFCQIWEEEVAPHIPSPKPQNRIESYDIITKWTMKKWLETR